MGVGGSKKSSARNGIGKGTASASIEAKDRSVLGLKLLRDQLTKNSKANVSFCEGQTTVAQKRLAAGDKIGALRALRRKRLYEQQAARVEAQLANIETMIASVEFAALQQQVTTALRSGTATLQEMQKCMAIEEVERVVENAAEAVSRTREVSDLLAQLLTPEDEDAAAEALHVLELAQAVVPGGALPAVAPAQHEGGNKALEQNGGILASREAVETEACVVVEEQQRASKPKRVVVA